MKRIQELDAMRGLAALAIVAYHFWFLDRGFLGTGVDLFFVMSGYLITSIILRQRDEPNFLRTFYIRRSLRIWPIYYISLIGVVILSRVLPLEGTRNGFLAYFTYMQNVSLYWSPTTATFLKCFNPTWTLAIEEQFYLLWPFLVLLWGRRRLLSLALVLCVLSVSLRIYGVPTYLLLTRLDGLAGGAALAILLEMRNRGELSSQRLNRLLITSAVLAGGFLVLGPRILSGLDRSIPGIGSPRVVQGLKMAMINVEYVALTALLIAQHGSRWLAPLRDRRLVYLGQISYGIYLYHSIVLEVVNILAARWGWNDRLSLEVVKVLLTFGVASASWRFIEQPFLTLKDRFEYRGSSKPSEMVIQGSSRLPRPNRLAAQHS